MRLAADAPHDITRRVAPVLLQKFLQAGFVVAPIAARQLRFQFRLDDRVDDARRGLLAAVFESRADERLDGAGENRFFVRAAAGDFGFAQPQFFAQAQPRRRARQSGAADEVLPQQSQAPFAPIGKAGEQNLARPRLQKRVAQPFEALVVVAPETFMSQGAPQQARIGERARQIRARGHYCWAFSSSNSSGGKLSTLGAKSSE